MTGPHPIRPLALKAIELAHTGLHVAEIARQTGLSHGGVRTLLKRHDVTPGKCTGNAARSPENVARAEKMASMYRQGLTLNKIGQHFHMTRERVRQIISQAGVTFIDGGQHKISASKWMAKASKRDAQSLARWGLGFEEAKLRRADGTLRAYVAQRHNALCRAVVWRLSFPQWLDVWLQSGKLAERGRGIGKYVMSRLKDEGGYVMGNVHIQLATENSSQGLAKCRNNKPAHTGVILAYPGLRKGWMAYAGRTKLGLYATESEAVAVRSAHLSAQVSQPAQAA